MAGPSAPDLDSPQVLRQGASSCSSCSLRTVDRKHFTMASKLTLLAALALPMAARGDAPLTAGCRPNYPENLCWESSPLKTRFGSFEYM